MLMSLRPAWSRAKVSRGEASEFFFTLIGERDRDTDTERMRASKHKQAHPGMDIDVRTASLELSLSSALFKKK